MKTILLGIIFGLFLVALAQAEDVPACCGATTHRPDLPGRTNGWANNLPPLDAVRFGQQSLGESQSHISTDQPPHYEPSEGSPNFNLLNLEDGGYNPGTGTYTPSTAKPEWYKSDKEWASDNLKKYWNLQ